MSPYWSRSSTYARPKNRYFESSYLQMAPRVYSDDEDAPPRRPKRVAVPSAKAHVAANAAPSHIQTPITVTDFDEDDSDIESLHSKTRRLMKGKKRARAAADGNSEGAELEPDSLLNEALPSATINPPQAPAIVDDELDADGFLKDVQVMDIDEPKKSRQEQRSRDINKIFSAPYSGDKGKKYRHCVLCSKKTKKPVAFVNEITTMRHHMDTLHRD
ncbi:hypothetical protein DEU56DRAFT_754884 [Suillus clintonianus]|uniref:uncharacterized protein n=1 Tax=Suillus clintonianus TaxID=1904413 RepID=UPI001B8618F8|nr:uncharacterized protein DEU56DRAFT_754884 [Suillus clintonianus]KAG2141923.1 hypothetical protein DEU56DRAFT_754884 [Suillus clintonianus]